jgi:hypothetical protein
VERLIRIKAKDAEKMNEENENFVRYVKKQNTLRYSPYELKSYILCHHSCSFDLFNAVKYYTLG